MEVMDIVVVPTVELQAAFKETLHRNYQIMLEGKSQDAPLTGALVTAMLDACAANLAQSYAGRVMR